MKKNERKILEIIAILIIPGAIPAWLGYKLYKKIKHKKEDNNE